ncbi:hypothetical protein MKEN_01126900 [Mycena kentingensis (nom. inval.)]|nr:hypothetical protein MKEN_01126900 [Mycena kentingensis (nom. inval.)]
MSPPLELSIPIPQSSTATTAPPSPCPSTGLKIRPTLLSRKIETFLGSPGDHRTQAVTALRRAPSAPVKLSRLCGRLMKSAMAMGSAPDANADHQLDAFIALVSLTTRFPILRRLFLRSVSVAGIPVAETDVGSLWPEHIHTLTSGDAASHADALHSRPNVLDAASQVHRDEWNFWRALAGTSLLECEVWSLVSRAGTDADDTVGTAPDVLDVLEQLVDLLEAAQSPISRALAIRYLLGVLENNPTCISKPPLTAFSPISPTFPFPDPTRQKQAEIVGRLSAALLCLLYAMDEGETETGWENGVGYDYPGLDALIESVLALDMDGEDTRRVVALILNRRRWLEAKLPRTKRAVTVVPLIAAPRHDSPPPPREGSVTPTAASFPIPPPLLIPARAQHDQPPPSVSKWDIELNIWTKTNLERKDVLADWQSGKGFLLESADTMAKEPEHAFDLDIVIPSAVPSGLQLLDDAAEEPEPESPSCSRCIGQFGDEPVVKFGSALFHPRCFTCAKCESILSPATCSSPTESSPPPHSFSSTSSASASPPPQTPPLSPMERPEDDPLLLVLTDADGTTPICTRCAYRCTACNFPILEEALLAGGDSYHADCFRCRVCRRGLASCDDPDEGGGEVFMSLTKTRHGAVCMPCYNERAFKMRTREKERAKTRARSRSRSRAYGNYGMSS